VVCALGVALLSGLASALTTSKIDCTAAPHQINNLDLTSCFSTTQRKTIIHFLCSLESSLKRVVSYNN
jgi:hypothetical protein